MKRKLLEILACPICKNHPLDLIVFAEREEIEEGIIVCSKCNRWYPIIESIPHMLPDDLRKEGEDLAFIEKWRERIPKDILEKGKPFNLGAEK